MKRIRKCIECGKEFDGRTNQKYCTQECKMATANKNKSDEFPVINTKTESDIRLTLLSKKQTPELIPITIHYAPKEIEMLEEQAEKCGVSTSQYIRIRSQMCESDVAALEEIIEKLKSENDDMRIKLSFYKHRINPAITNEDGIYISMNKSQKKFLVEKYLETQDTYMEADIYKLPDGKLTSSHLEYLETHEKHSPGFVEKRLQYSILLDYLFGLQDTLIEDFGYFDEDFEDIPLDEAFARLGKE
ncbi:MAG: hypothetical protein WCM76_12055 [Bacteroidota bacterium]